MTQCQPFKAIGAVLLSLALALVLGCGNSRGPIGTSLTELTSETRKFSGLVPDQAEMISIAGLIGTPAPGLIYHMVRDSDQQSLLGVSYDTKSFMLIGESLPEDMDIAAVVSKLKRAIEAHDRYQSELLEEIVNAQAIEQKWITLSGLGKEPTQKGDPAAIAARGRMLQLLESQITVRNQAIEAKRQRVAEEVDRIRKLSSTGRHHRALAGQLDGVSRHRRGSVCQRARRPH